MARPITKKVDVTTSEDTKLIGSTTKTVLIKNQGNNDCQIDFDTAISTDSYLLETGETLSTDHPFIRLHFKGVGSTTLYLIILT